MANSTARVAERNPVPTDGNIQRDSVIERGVAATLEHIATDPDAENSDFQANPNLAFFHEMQRYRNSSIGGGGEDWDKGTTVTQPRRVARIDRCSHGLNGLLQLLRADFVARTEADRDYQLGDNLMDRLLLAAQELGALMEDDLDQIYDRTRVNR